MQWRFKDIKKIFLGDGLSTGGGVNHWKYWRCFGLISINVLAWLDTRAKRANKTSRKLDVLGIKNHRSAAVGGRASAGCAHWIRVVTACSLHDRNCLCAAEQTEYYVSMLIRRFVSLQVACVKSFHARPKATRSDTNRRINLLVPRNVPFIIYIFHNFSNSFNLKATDFHWNVR